MDKPIMISGDGPMPSFLQHLLDKAEGIEHSGVDNYTATKMLTEFDMSIVKCEFKAGDFITPKKHAGVKGQGEPHRVVTVYPEMQYHLEAVYRELKCYNMVVSQVIHKDHVAMYVALSTDYEPYKGIVYPEMEEVNGS